MSKPIHLYVSSSPDLYAEREAVAQIVAALPLTIGWRISHTPPPGQVMGDDVLRVGECDLYAVILGHDFAAPMGFELRQALARVQRPMTVYRKDCTFSPSAQEAVRTLDLSWQRFSTLDAFRSMFKRDLLQAVLQQATALGLELDEVQRLVELSREAAEEDSTRREPGRGRGDAGRSGRILGREVWEADPRERGLASAQACADAG
jgi:hypothetical protein